MNNTVGSPRDGHTPARRFGGCIAIVVVVIGCLCLANVWFLLAGDSLEVLQTSWYLQNNGETTAGVISSMEEESRARPGDNTVYRLVVEYTVNGTTYTVRSYSAYGALATHKVGDAIDVIYDPANPQNAQVDIFTERWLNPLIRSLPF